MEMKRKVAVAAICGCVAFYPLTSFGATQQGPSAQTSGSASSQESSTAMKQSTQTQEASAQKASAQQNGEQEASQNQEQNAEREMAGEKIKEDSLNKEEDKGQKQEIGNQKTGGTKEEKNQRSQERKSQVALAVQTMERIGENNQGIGEQVRTIARSQKDKQEEIEESLVEAQNRSGMLKFLIGSNYGKLKKAEDGLAEQETKIEEMKKLAAQIENEEDAQMLLEHIAIMEQIRGNALADIEDEKKGFSLFGWIFKWLAK